MPFCSECGKELANGTKFCPNCGHQVNGTTVTEQSQRKQTFDGEIRKCPNCGAVLNAFELACPTCGMEIRGVNVSNVVQDFYKRLQALEGTRQQESFIQNFPIPNTKEDILEFIILASSNIKPIAFCDDSLNLAWTAKFEQAYQKALVTIKDGSDIERIRELYEAKKERVKKAKSNLLLVRVCLLIGLALCIALFAIFNENEKGMPMWGAMMCGLGLFASLVTRTYP